MTAGLQVDDARRRGVSGDTEAGLVLRAAWLRFVSKFPGRCDETEALASRYDGHNMTVAAELSGRFQRLAGVAGTVGFPRVGRCAAELESLLANGLGPEGAQDVRKMLPWLREIFAAELATGEPSSGTTGAASTERLIVCIVEDDAEQRDLLARQVECAGHQVMTLATSSRSTMPTRD